MGNLTSRHNPDSPKRSPQHVLGHGPAPDPRTPERRWPRSYGARALGSPDPFQFTFPPHSREAGGRSAESRTGRTVDSRDAANVFGGMREAAQHDTKSKQCRYKSIN